MTDRIDLDEYATESEEPDDADTANPGDWFWRETGDPMTETATATDENGHDETTTAMDTDTVNSTDTDAADSTDTDTTIPRVPRENDDKPVGIPVEQGGAGGTSTEENDESITEPTRPAASGPHGGGVDDMTLVFTYEAAKRFSKPQHVFADARQWADWIGIIGHTEAHVLNTFQRHHNLDLDFFNGTGTGPDERLAEIDEHSMFFAERMVVVGCDNETEIAETADWEFVPLQEATTKADWELDE
jgi:hypothetical protein